jgi:hypothetical protein
MRDSALLGLSKADLDGPAHELSATQSDSPAVQQGIDTLGQLVLLISS